MKNIYLLSILLFCLAFNYSYAGGGGAPANDDCAGAISLTVGASCSYSTYSNASATLTSGPPAPGCASLTEADVWFKFVCPAGGSVQIDTQTGGITDSGIALYSGSCATTLIECDDDDSNNGAMSYISRTGLTAGATYYIRVWEYGGGTTGNFGICVTTPPPPPANDNCAGAINVPINANLSCGTTVAGTVTAATASGTPLGTCGGTADDDVWYKFTATGTTHSVGFTGATGSTTDFMCSVYSGSCASLSQICCYEWYGTGSVSISGLTIGNVYYIRIFSWSSSPQTATFNVCVGTPPPPPANDECTNATALTMNTYGSCASSTAGTVQSATASSQASGCGGTDDDDVWYKFQATASAHPFQLTGVAGSTTDMYHSVYSGTCASIGTPILCNDSDVSNITGLTVGNWYYVRVYTWTSTAGQTSTFNACVQAPPSCPGAMGGGVVNVASLPYSNASENLNGTAANDFTSTNVVSCGTSYYFDNYDKVYVFTPSSSGNVTVTVNSTTSYLGATLFEGCPFSGSCVSYVQSSSSGAKSFCTSVVAGTTYYLVVDAWNTATNMSYSISITAPTSGAANDLPCNATSIFNGVSQSGDLNCASGSGEPAVPSCWTTGNVNSVWYKFQATSTQMYVQTTLTTTPSTQIAVYSGACGSGMTLVACNQDAGSTGCAGSATQNSLLDLSALTIGTWYYVRVDGENNDVGTFNIILNDGLSTTTNDALLGQDCQAPLSICTGATSVPNPSFAGTGNICDFTSTNNCTSGEKNSVWYTFQVGTSGNLNFTIYPNDATDNSNGAETDYDWVLWKLTSSTGAVVNTCATLNAAPPVACNFGSPGITGLSSGGNAPGTINTYFNSTFEPTVSVTANETYLLVVQNYETTSSGFSLNFNSASNPSTAGVIDNTPNTLYWTGTTNSNFSTTTNYSGCALTPDCGINVVINNQGSQPTMTTTQGYTTITGTSLGGSFYRVKDLTINSGATLTLQAGVTLQICGNLTNYGNLVCSPTSTVIFADGANTTQNITGNFINTNKFGNLTVTKGAGSVICNNNITIGGNFTTTNNTSKFDSNNKHIKLAGHFSNATGNTTYMNTGTVGTLEFIGTGLQNYNQGSAVLDLNYVILNNTAGVSAGVTLLTDMNIKATTGTLTLTLGTITTGGTLNTGSSPITITGGYRVIVNNLTPTSVTDGNNSSFVNGTLRRYANDPGNYSWPVGNAAKGYQLAKTNFSAMNNSMHYIDCRFDPWLITYTIGSAECGKLYDLESMNNGMWTFMPDGGTCTYDCTLYPNNVTNILGSAYTIVKRSHLTAISTTGWALNGTCATSTSSAVTRTGMTDFSLFGVDQGIVSTPIELIYFDGKKDGNVNVLQWETSSERENDYFELQRSVDGNKFEVLTTIDGAGTTISTSYYNYTDKEPYSGYNYYRFKQVDYNGSETFSNTVLIENNGNEFAVSNLYPNPTNKSSNCVFYSPKTGELNVNIVDNSGRIVENSIISIKSETNTGIQINSEQFENGIYSIEFNFNKGEFKTIQKLVKH
ncbi:MAG: pre-peptidase C-terminal domain-containing protein [Flavobacteriia bacterium]|nr:pre-peptidase C-terminal domain-containing protein [Flavobacteriia bacterium]